MYNIQLTGVMATEAALLVITNIQNLTEGLDLGIVVLFLQEQGNTLETRCNDHNEAFPSEILSVIAILVIIITIMVLFTLIFIVYLR